MATYKQLLAEKEALEAKLNEVRATEVAGVIDKIRDLMTEYGLTVEDILPRAEARIKLQRIGGAFLLDVLGNLDHRAHRGRGELDLAGAVEQPKDREAPRDRIAPGEQTVVAQDHRRLLADALQQSRPLAGMHGDTFEVVIGDFAVELR